MQYSNESGDHDGFPHLEEWRIELGISSLVNFFTNMDTYRDSYDYDFELLQVAYQSPHFTQLGLPDVSNKIIRFDYYAENKPNMILN